MSVKYLIEDLRTGKWKSISAGMVDTSKPHCIEDDWTNDPHMAAQYNTREDAEKDSWSTMHDVAVTEHEFINDVIR